MRLYAPAKVNWTLEALGRREDGYHEVRTVMQTVEPCDTLRVWAEERPGDPAPPEGAGDGPLLMLRGGNLRLGFAANEMWPGGGRVPGTDLIFKTADLLDPDWKRLGGVDIAKQIPFVAGLGGSSSDAAAALRALNDVWGLHHDGAALTELAAQIGSDVPFFLHGGTALVVPPLHLPEKTRRMYAALTPSDFTDGSRTEALAEQLRAGMPIRDGDLYNAFERAAYAVFEGLDVYREALLAAGAGRVHLAGAGPALFALAEDEAGANAIRDKVSLPAGGRVFVVRTLTAAESLRREG